MRTPVLDRAPSRPKAPARARRHHRSTIVVATGALTLLAVTAGAAVALVSRPARPEAPAAVASPASTPTTIGPVVRTPAPDAPVATTPRQEAPGTPVSHRAPAPDPVLANGTYPVFIRKLDADRRTMVVDVIQVFEGKAAAQASIEDGHTPYDPDYLFLYIRNQNPRLRTLPVAPDATIKLLSTCEGPAPRAVLTLLAKHAATRASYYSITVKDGSVRRVEEHQTQPAC
jgi:hypothetical protein